MWALYGLVLSASSIRAFQVYLGNKTYMGFTTDQERNRIPNFSYSGFQNGNSSTPPNTQIQITLQPCNGDCTAYIQQAVDVVGGFPIINGTRGAVLLSNGIWNISGTIVLKYSGVSLLGVGSGTDPNTNTILQATGSSSQYAMVKIGANKINWYLNSKNIYILDDEIPIGGRTIRAQDTQGLKVGDNIVLTYPANDNWLNLVDRGGTFTAPPWSAGFTSIAYLRRIIMINRVTNTIIMDSPIFEKMTKSISNAYITPFDDSGITKNVIVSDLRLRILPSSTDPQDQNHAPTNILIDGAEDVWVYKCVMTGFLRSGISIFTSSQVTVSECFSIEPIGVSVENNFYNYCVERGAQNILFKNNYASGGRHHYIVNGMTLSSGIVFLNNTSFYPSSQDEAHRQWSTGILYDNHKTRVGGNYATVGLYSRGRFGTSHGWSCAHCVLWNSQFLLPDGSVGGGVMVQKPPSAQNYAIGNTLSIASGQKPPCPFPGSTGWVETISNLDMVSLYDTQLTNRLGTSPSF